MYRVCNLSHLDLDGISAAASIKLAHDRPGQHVTTKFCHYQNINQTLLTALTRAQPYSRIVLSDISFAPTEKDKDLYKSHEERMLVEHYIPQAISKFVQSGGELVVLDHHPRALDIKRQYKDELHPESICEIKDKDGVARAGSELAATYYLQNSNHPVAKKAIVEALGELAGDYDVWRDPLGYGGTLAMGCDLMDDPETAMQCMLQVIDTMHERLKLDADKELTAPMFAEDFSKTILGEYANVALVQFEDQVQVSLASAIHHHPLVTEIYAKNFSSLVAMRIYEETKGAVIVRYDEDRKSCGRLSLRRSLDLDVDFTRIAKIFKGGGHPFAAGISGVRGKIDEVVKAVIDNIKK